MLVALLYFLTVTPVALAQPTESSPPAAAELVAPAPALSADVPSTPSTPALPAIPLDRLGWAAGAALIINRLLQLLKNHGKFLPKGWRPYLPLVAALLGLAAGACDMVVTGSPWYMAVFTAVVGTSGAVFVREAGRAVAHAKKPSDPPKKKGNDMSDQELVEKITEG